MFSPRKYRNVLGPSVKYKHKPATSNCRHFCMLWCHAGGLPGFWIFVTPFAKTAANTALHTLTHCKSVPPCQQPCSPCNVVYVCVYVCRWALWSSLGPEIKAMSASVWWDLTDDTSSLSPFSILALLVSLSPRLSNTLFSHPFLSLVPYFFSLSICLTDFHSLWSLLLFLVARPSYFCLYIY